MAGRTSDSRPESSLAGYFRTVGRHRVLDRERELELARRAAGGSDEAREQLVLANLAFVVKVAREYQGIGMPFEDLLSEGTIGLIEASDRFDPKHGTRFVTYATWWVRKRIIEALTDRARLVRIPAGRLRQLRQVLDTQKRLARKLDRSPSLDELIEASGESRQIVTRALLLPHRETANGPKNEDGKPLDPVDLLEEPSSAQAIERLLDGERSECLDEALGDLEPRELQVISLRHGLGGGEPMTLRSLGEKLDLSRERVRQIELHAGSRLRRSIKRRRRPWYRTPDRERRA